MKKLGIIFYAILILVIIIAAIALSNKNNSTQSGSNVTLQITSSGSWNGTYTYNNGTQVINGAGNAGYNLGPNPGAVTVSLVNQGNETLTVELLQGSNMVQTQSTSDNKGVVNINQQF